MAALSSFYSSVRLYAQQCPDATIDKYLLEAVREFCRQSWYYQATLVTNVVAAQSVYTITPSTGEEVIAIAGVELDGSTLTAFTQEDIGRNDITLTGFQFEPPNYLNISPEPTENITDGLEVRLVLQPAEGASTIADSIYRNHKETIVAGALAYILSQQNEAWSNPSLAQFMLQRFEVGYKAAKGERMRSFRPGTISVRPRPFLI